MRFPRAVQLDGSDAQIYERNAQAGEWVIPGGFAFWDRELDGLTGKQRAAFRHGFLGTESFGWTTIARVDEISESQLQALIERLAEHLLAHYGAPDIWAARAAAHEEAEFAISLCEHPVDTLIAIQRSEGEDGIVEEFRVVQPPSGADHSGVRIWASSDS